MIPIRVDPDSVFRRPDFHDGYLHGIHVVEHSKDDQELVLWLEHVDGSLYKLVMPALDRLEVMDFWEGNIVFEVLFYCGEQISDEQLLQIYHTSPPNETDFEWVKEHRLLVHQENWTLMRIKASYGCRLLALSRNPIESIKLEPVTSIG